MTNTEEKTKKTPENADDSQKTATIKQSKKQLFGEIIRFLIVGGTATVFDYAVAYVFYQWLLPPELVGQTWSLIISTALGFCVGLIINWLLSISFVFKQVTDKKTTTSGKSFAVFAVIGVIGLGLTELGMHFGINLLPEMQLFGSTLFLGTEWKWWICKVITTCIVLIWNYLGRKLFVFK